MARPLREQAYDRLGDEIASGQLAAGSVLNERGVGERFGMSRTPAREVLLQLSAAGLVRLVPRRGAVVLGASPREVVSMIEVLVALEGEAVGLAARRMTGEERERLAAAHAAGADSVARMSAQDYSEANLVFHDVIYAGCRNDYLTAQIKALRMRLAPYLRHSFVRQERMKSSYAEHGAIVQALLAHDDAAAVQAMRGHLLNGGNLFADMLARLGSP